METPRRPFYVSPRATRLRIVAAVREIAPPRVVPVNEWSEQARRVAAETKPRCIEVIDQR